MRKIMVCDIPKGKRFIYRGDVYRVAVECDCDDTTSRVIADRVSLYCKGRVTFPQDTMVLLCE